LNIALYPEYLKNNKTKIMKKFFLVTGILIATTITATYAQYNIDDINVQEEKSINTNTLDEIQKEGRETNQNAVSEFTENQFSSDFPNATNIRFENAGDFNEVYFKQNGRKTTAYYDLNNQLVGTIRNRSFFDLPLDAQMKIVDKYPNSTVVKVIQFKVNSDNESYIDNNMYLPLYGNSFEKISNYFVELKKDNKAIVLEVDLSGEVSFFTTIK
jgi:hypothetical protein